MIVDSTRAMRVDHLLKEGFVTIIELHPLEHRKQGGGAAKSAQRLNIIDKALRLRQYADIITITESTSPAYSHSTLKTVQMLKRHSAIEVIPHLTLRLYTPEKVRGLIRECEDTGIQSLFVVRGDGFAPGEGSYAYSSEMIRHLLEISPGLSVGAACNPHAPEDQEIISVSAKVRSGAAYLISQPVFSVKQYTDYVGWLRGNGIAVPVIPGVMPLKSGKAIEFVEKNIREIAIPTDVKELHLNAEDIRATCVAFNKELITGLREAGAPGIDLFSRGDVGLAEDILRAAAEEGEFHIIKSGARSAPQQVVY